MHPAFSRFIYAACRTRRIRRSPNLRARLERALAEDRLDNWFREEAVAALAEDRARRQRWVQGVLPLT